MLLLLYTRKQTIISLNVFNGSLNRLETTSHKVEVTSSNLHLPLFLGDKKLLMKKKITKLLEKARYSDQNS